jgi:predicted permease
MTWRDAVRLSGVAYLELSLQAIYAFRQGNPVPPGDAHQLVPRARRRVLQSKVIIGFVLGMLALGASVALRASARIVATGIVPPNLPLGLFDAGLLTGLLSLDVAFLWWTGLQVLPTFLSSGVLPVLEPLPIDDTTLRRTAGLLYLRLFDLPALTVLIATPLFVGLAVGWTAGLAIIPGTVAAVTFALALALVTGRFFVRRVQGARGGGGSTLVRWGYLILWVIPAFAMFGFVVAAPAFFAGLERLAASGSTLGWNLLLAAFPFSLASLPAIAAQGSSGFGFPTGAAVLGAAAIGYAAVAAAAGLWMMNNVRSLGITPPIAEVGPPVARMRLVPRSAAFAVLTKDLRIASRTPGYAFLILLPILDAVAIGLWTYISASGSSAALGVGIAAVTIAALLATFFGPAFFAIEVNAYSYGRTLPLSDRSILLGKVALVSLMYLVAGALVLGLTLLRVFDPALFVAFVVAELPAVLAAAFFELGILFWRARRKGLPIVNLYSGQWYAVLVTVPGLLVAGAPILLFHLLSSGGTVRALAGMAALALAELAACAPLALRRHAS